MCEEQLNQHHRCITVAGGSQLTERIHPCDVCTPTRQDLLAYPWGLVAPLTDREKRVVCSSCELLSSLDPARGSVHSSALPHCEKHQQAPSGLTFRDVLLGVRLPGGVCLTEITRELHRWVWLYWEAPRALL